MENLENNKLIADFMEYYKDHESFYLTPFDEHNLIHPDKMKFHSDWNWLIPVVEKIESAGHIVVIKGLVVYITDCNDEVIISSNIASYSKIDRVYNVVYRFINFIKEQ